MIKSQIKKPLAPLFQSIHLKTLHPEVYIDIEFKAEINQGTVTETLKLGDQTIVVSDRHATEADLQQLVNRCYPNTIWDNGKLILINGQRWRRFFVSELFQEVLEYSSPKDAVFLFARLIGT